MTLDLQEFADEVVDAIRREDVDAYLSLMAVPYQIVTATESRTIEKMEGLADHFATYCKGLRQLGFEDLSHKMISTTLLGPDLAVGIYQTDLYRDDHLYVAPFRSVVTVRRGEDLKWRAVASAHTINHADWTGRMDAVSGSTNI
ncbi:MULTISPECIES: hypothetical protein [unclassified Sulfitobacter]|uniref:hypothetical protein n=2 Tax=Sulfitobacter TaxID=60136 RepID=UPI0007C3551E|nr:MULTISPECIES: hypothetical protein [unclassified Sulfitobacter]MAM24924.1 hypothetical protein [Paracoccaceae bacterium]KZX94513.1 hypothetical protein A3721_09735 [Sulfitobacter sp. HI0023]KZY23835.1 hypothetical protein A3728_07330 [Sulfitobacter sp. HI0040]KZZ70040.1 hypothetical protein A3764_08935 [Sulfitobacter sp. HI0129]MBO29353.1 hypothetical protein [Paracoccaceae bacterium]|tara:strand:- start:828 stop:1259 length:432 start_codon:yes stop_codon:yes gene_type:complete